MTGVSAFQYWIDDSPCLFDIVLSGKQGRISRHSVSQDAFISIHFLRARVPAHYQFVSLADRILSRGDNVYAEGQ
jgi:hypothetical protein